MAVLLIVWAVPLARGVGGRDPHAQLITLVIMLPAVLCLRPWRLRSGPLLAAAGVSAAALLVCVLSPSGWSGSDVASGYIIAAGFLVAALSYATSPRRRELLCGGVCLAGMYQFSLAFLPWWGGRDPRIPMNGTFYWHNPYAAFLLPAAVLGLAFAIQGRAPWRLVGWISAPLCTAGIVLSSSRATLAVLVVAWVLVLVAGVVDRRTAVRAAAASAAAVALTFALPGPPFFTHYTSPFAATAARSTSGQSLATNGLYRTEFWREALAVGRHHPLVGAGFHSLATASALYTPSGWARSQLAHNGYLQAWADGGMLLALPFLLCLAVIGWWALRRAYRGVVHRLSGHELLPVAAAVALLGGMAHSAVDFDWSHPVILVEAGLLAAVVAPTTLIRSGAVGRLIPFTALACLGISVGIMIPALHQWQRDEPSDQQSATLLLSRSSATFGDYRPAAALLSTAAGGTSSPTDAQLERALALTASESRVDRHLQLARLAMMARLGQPEQAVRSARAILDHVDGAAAPYVPDLAAVLVNAGEPDAARALLASDIRTQITAGVASPDLPYELQQWAQSLGSGASYACELTSVRGLLPSAEISELPSASASCRAQPSRSTQKSSNK